MKFFIRVVFIVLEVIIRLDYVMGYCERIQIISESSNNATGSGPFVDGSAIEFTCNSGYKGVGSTIFYCRGSEWAGNFSCDRVCPQIKTPQNGLIVGNPEYVENTTIEFACLDGYTIAGSSSMLCSADGNWTPEAPPTCDPVSCGDFGSVPNGNVSQIKPAGVLNDFRSKLRITCNDGYNLIGSPIVTCKSDGTWSSRVGCEASVCGTHPGSKSQCIYDSATSSDGVLLSLLCHENSDNVSVTVVGTLTGTVIAVCIGNQWNNRDMGCFCDCLVDTDSKEGLTYHNLFNKKFVKHGDTLNWECDEGYKKQGLTNITCNDGQMEKPQCIRVETRREMTEGEPVAAIAILICTLGILGTLGCIIIIRYGVRIKENLSNMVIKRCCTNRKQNDTKESIDQTDTIESSLDQSCTERLTIQSPPDRPYTEPLITQSTPDRPYTEPLITQSTPDQSCTEPLITQSLPDRPYTEPRTTQSYRDVVLLLLLLTLHVGQLYKSHDSMKKTIKRSDKDR